MEELRSRLADAEQSLATSRQDVERKKKLVQTLRERSQASELKIKRNLTELIFNDFQWFRYRNDRF